MSSVLKCMQRAEGDSARSKSKTGGMVVANKVDKKDKKKYRVIRLWVILAIISFMILISLTFAHTNELTVRNWGHSIEAEYIENGNYRGARYVDEQGTLHTYDLSSYSPVHDGDKITLYYTNNIDDVQPENSLLSWLLYYLFFGAVFGVSMWQIHKFGHSKQ